MKGLGFYSLGFMVLGLGFEGLGFLVCSFRCRFNFRVVLKLMEFVICSGPGFEVVSFGNGTMTLGFPVWKCRIKGYLKARP